MRTSGFKQSEPGGLYLPMHATLKGRVRWQVLDERGVPEVPRTPSGIPVGPVEGVEQDNLITNYGLDKMADSNVMRTVTSTSGNSANHSWKLAMAIGTGSGAPDVSDNTLDNEVQRAISTGAFSDGNVTYLLDTDNDAFTAEVLTTRLVTLAQDRNLTEFGFGSGSLGSPEVVIRELLRDGGGNPITVSLLNGKSLRVDHTLFIALPAPEFGIPITFNVDEFDAGNNLVASHPYDVTYGPWTSQMTQLYLGMVFDMWQPGKAIADGQFRRLLSDVGYERVANRFSQLESANASLIWEAYATGTYTRTKRGTISTGNANGLWYGFAFTDVNRNGGLYVKFDDPVTYTKVNTDTLRGGVVSTWARA